LHQVNNELPGLKLNWYDWWQSHSVETVAQKHNIKPAHANWLEAFAFTVVGDMPETDKVPPKTPSAIMDAGTAREVYGDGSFGGAYRVSGEIMHELFAACLEDILQLLSFE
jgi:creatinine amidohydrolase